MTVAEGARQRYGTHHPEPSEIRLLVEVSDSSVAIDRTFKSTLYAAAGIERYWIVNLLKLPKEPPLTLLVQDLLP